ncbi:polyketide synthase, partial [Micromonospora sp. LOL_015]|uniref:beta-ketoacyl [acyl carrier protein] synthase domain-containing protein n=1 Tax=Micromonospora sp. LOL_015 TaxID=3345416 RepID=UPI003A8A8CA4
VIPSRATEQSPAGDDQKGNGVNVMLSPYSFVLLSKFRALAPDGRCKTFDASADGYGRGDGAGIVVLKRLADAHRDGDTVMAVIRGSAVAHDGRSSGLTVPNPASQRKVVEAALRAARLEPAEIDYVEAHGTGTALGDPIELRALDAVLGGSRPAGSRLLVGSVKTNIGHLEAAAGIAGLLKLVLALQRRAVPPQLHFQEPNPNVDWDRLRVTVADELLPWPARGAIRAGGISSFGRAERTHT